MSSVSNLNVKSNRLQRVCRSPKWSLGYRLGLQILRLKIPQGSKLLKQGPPEVLIDIPLLPAGFWLAAELGHSRPFDDSPVFWRRQGGRAEEACSCKSGDPDWATSSMSLDVSCPFSIYCWQHDKAFCNINHLKTIKPIKQTKHLASKHIRMSDFSSVLAVSVTLLWQSRLYQSNTLSKGYFNGLEFIFLDYHTQSPLKKTERTWWDSKAHR